MKYLNPDPIEHLMVDGCAVVPGTPSLPAGIPGILRGEGIFEAFRVEESLCTPFLADHDARLHHSASLMDMELEGRGLVQEWPVFRAILPTGPWRVRYTILVGADERLVRFWSAGRPIDAPDEIALSIAVLRRDPNDPLASAKTTSRAGWQVARRRAQSVGAWDAILPTVEGGVSECTTSNIFLWRNGELQTPSPESGLLRGITRASLLAAAREAEIPCKELLLPISALAEAQEIFVTSAVMGVLPVCRIHGVRDGLPGVAGPQLAVLRAVYARRREQALAAAEAADAAATPLN